MSELRPWNSFIISSSRILGATDAVAQGNKLLVEAIGLGRITFHSLRSDLGDLGNPGKNKTVINTKFHAGASLHMETTSHGVPFRNDGLPILLKIGENINPSGILSKHSETIILATRKGMPLKITLMEKGFSSLTSSAKKQTNYCSIDSKTALSCSSGTQSPLISIRVSMLRISCCVLSDDCRSLVCCAAHLASNASRASM